MAFSDSQLGYAEESTPGTAVTVTRFAELTDESVKCPTERIESKAIRAGRKTQDRWASGRTGAEGDISLEVMPAGFGLLAKHMLGSVATTTPGGGTLSRLHTAKVGGLDGKSLTIQFGRPGSAGVVHPFTYNGVKIAEWELSQDVDGLLEVKLGVDAWGETTATALAVASYPATADPLSFVGATITYGGTAYDVAKFSLKGSNGLKTDRNRLGSATKLQQLEGDGLREYTGTMELESFKDLTPYGLYKAGTEGALVALFEGALIEGALKYYVRVTLPRVRLDGDTPNIEGQDLLGQSLPFKAFYSAAASTEVQIEVQNQDVAA